VLVVCLCTLASYSTVVVILRFAGTVSVPEKSNLTAFGNSSPGRIFKPEIVIVCPVLEKVSVDTSTPGISLTEVNDLLVGVLGTLIVTVTPNLSKVIVASPLLVITNFAKIPEATLVVIKTRQSNIATVAISILLALRISLTPFLKIYEFVVVGITCSNDTV
jgi:hypothetical protein